MHSLIDNAVQSIVLGIEDYEADGSERALSAVRNLYAGVLLLGKEVLVRHAPNAKPDVVLAARLKLVPDGEGGVAAVPHGRQTVDFETLGQRLKDFGLEIDLANIRRLSEIRNDVEHRSTDLSSEALREHIAAVFPTILQLFRHACEKPGDVLGDAWPVILDVHDAYEDEARACGETLAAVKWGKQVMDELRLRCPMCASELVEQLDANNSDPLSMSCYCRACRSELDPQVVMEVTVIHHFKWENYVAMTDGDEQSVGFCPECYCETYLSGTEDDGCAVCGVVLEKCVLCYESLNPSIVSHADSSLCSYCHDKINRDD